MPSSSTDSHDGSFEDALERLEELVDTLEEDPPALDDALDAYEEGVALANECLTRLDEAEQRMSELSVDSSS
jgi:exodeoxyribonuclease VII small subunit